MLDLRTGLLGEEIVGATRVQSVRFSSLARPGIAVLRADVDPPDASDALVSPDGAVLSGREGEYEWMAVRGTGGSITAAAWQERDAIRLDRIAAYVVGDDGAEPDRAVVGLGERARPRIRLAARRAPSRVGAALGARRHPHRG